MENINEIDKFLTAEDIEQDNLAQEESEESISIQRYAFNAFRIERSIRDILSWVDKGKIIIPEFQRDFVWNFNQSSRFIESILLGLPNTLTFVVKSLMSEFCLSIKPLHLSLDIANASRRAALPACSIA